MCMIDYIAYNLSTGMREVDLQFTVYWYISISFTFSSWQTVLTSSLLPLDRNYYIMNLEVIWDVSSYITFSKSMSNN